MTTDAEGGAPEVGEVISPGPNSEPAIDVAATARKRTEMTPTDRIEARADRHIEGLTI